MAEVLSEFPAHTSRGGSAAEKYLDGQIWRIDPADFGTIKKMSMRSKLLAAAIARGGRIRTRTPKDGSLIVQFITK